MEVFVVVIVKHLEGNMQDGTLTGLLAGYLFNGISTPHGLFKAEILFISKYLITTRTIL